MMRKCNTLRMLGIKHADERARLDRAGKPSPFIDGQIAAVAFVNELTLITLNPKAYAPFCGLQVRTW